MDESKHYAYAVYSDLTTLSDYLKTAEVIVLRCDMTWKRRARANSVNALKHAIEKAHKVTLEKVRVSYDETYGFLPRTEIRYQVTRKAANNG